MLTLSPGEGVQSR